MGACRMKKILFITATRADFGKLKSLMRVVEESTLFHCSIFATGMHNLARYGNTINEIYRSNFSDIHVFINQIHSEPMDLVLANTIGGLSRYIHENLPDLIIVHGDRIEALAGAIVGSLNNILVAHIEGGEVSGTIDELIRHSVSKLSHLHFVSNDESKHRLLQLGEREDAIFVIGSPDIDAMLSPNLPTIKETKRHYNITFENYGILLYHSVTTEIDRIAYYTEILVNAIIESNFNYIVVYPNNDMGSEQIFAAYDKFLDNPRFRVIPSIRFEFFLTLLKYAKFIIGNSSAGVHEAPVYGTYSINIGTRQMNRFIGKSIINVDYNQAEIVKAIEMVKGKKPCKPSYYFGSGNSAVRFREIIEDDILWNVPKQKQFCDLAFAI
jgi:UDP-N-acetylglucosamine 2-epimerase (hydrolysing)